MNSSSVTNSQIDLAVLIAGIEKLNRRLDKLEAASSDQRSANNDRQTPHPSREVFNIAEAIADSVFGQNEKACTFEPNDKPCDHCSMCSSRGF